jgi:hypothetical protein
MSRNELVLHSVHVLESKQEMQLGGQASHVLVSLLPKYPIGHLVIHLLEVSRKKSVSHSIHVPSLVPLEQVESHSLHEVLSA